MRGRVAAGVVLVAVAAGGAATALIPFNHAALPAPGHLANPESRAVPADLAATRDLGRHAFYAETFGNEVFLSDVLGLLDGALRPWAIARAVLALGGKGTTNLRVALSETVTVGGRTYLKGTPIDTGLDVPRGGWAPLGLKLFWERGRLRTGVTCAACHAAVDAASGRVIEGAPNSDLHLGLMLALAPNSAALFARVTMPTVAPYLTDPARLVPTATGEPRLLPDPERFERDVDAMLAAWPPGSFDATLDLVSNPSQITDTFTAEAYPYGWTGFAAIGPHRGLGAMTNALHGLADATLDAGSAPALLGMDPQVYLGILLQNAARGALRYTPGSGRKPSDVLAAHDPTPGIPGLGHAVLLPTYPDANLVTTNSVLLSLPGHPVWRHVDALAVFQNSLQPPAAPPRPAPADIVAHGRQVFERAGCTACHGGPALTNHAVVPATDLGAHFSRAQALASTRQGLAEPILYPPDTPVPLPDDATVIGITLTESERRQIALSWAQGGAPGGYKVKGLVGLAWTAPFLHDGGAATLDDLLDRDLRRRAVAAHQASATARASHITGFGHTFFVDAAAGFSPEDRPALIAYLLSLTRLSEEPAPAVAATGEAP